MAVETIYKTVNDNGEYSCGDIGISKEEWFDLLKHPEAKQYFDTLCCFLRMPEHAGTCTAVAKRFGKSYEFYNAKVSDFASWVQRKLNRFKVLDTNGKETFWCIPMQKGWESKQGFVWQLRDELVEVLQYYLMKALVIRFRESKELKDFDESYKWKLLDITKGKDNLDIIKSLRGINLVHNAMIDPIFKSLSETKPDELTAVVEHLFDESKPIDERIAAFKKEMKSICPSNWRIFANDERTASALLMCKQPNKYTAYKDEVYQLVCQYFGFNTKKVGHKFSHFIEIVERFVVEFGEEIQGMIMPQIDQFRNKPLNLAVQTVFWCMREYMNTKLASKTINIEENTETINEDDMPQQKYKEYINLLREVHNLVLTGAPGTGKTFMAQAIADEMGAVTQFVQFHPSYDYTDFVEGLRPIEKSDGQMGFERKDGVFKEFCREAIKNLVDSAKSIEILTKEMSWQEKLDRFVEDAIENETKYQLVNGSEFTISEMKGHSIVMHNEQNEKTTEVTVNGDEILELLTNEVQLNIVRDIRNYFKRKFGTQPDSYAFVITKAVRAMKQKMPEVMANKIDRKPYVFIIDEINRGEASKIFGELFYAIDPGYRGKKDHLVQTQYQNLVPETDVFAKGFYVPENVYILATMNDIDRSVESMDFAMRRRFTWHEVKPADTESMLNDLPCAVEAKDTMHRLNDAIAETDGLGAAYMIGPSYFLKLGDNGCDFNKLWKMNIEPLLKEYLRGFRKTDEILDKFSKAYFGNNQETATDNPLLEDEN
mgnify:CR=1 FL=1